MFPNFLFPSQTLRLLLCCPIRCECRSPPPSTVGRSSSAAPWARANRANHSKQPERRATEEGRDGVGSRGGGGAGGAGRSRGRGARRSWRKASSKDPEGRVFSATTPADAAALLGELHNQILAGRASFADLAAKHSDCSSVRHGGDLGLKSAHYTAVASPSARLGQPLCRSVDVWGGGSPGPTLRRHIPLHGSRHGCVEVHLQAHACGRGGRVPGGGNHGAAPKRHHPQRRPR
ncbi:hypothetical protein VPH35_073287 [Triticum aestivum]